MHPVSFIVDGSGVSKAKLTELSSRTKQLLKEGIRCEFILYVNDVSLDNTLLPGVTIVSSKAPSVSAFRKALATASGDTIVISTLDNVFRDNENKIAKQATQHIGTSLAVPAKRQSKLRKVTGIRRVTNVPYYFVSKQFANSHAYLLHDLRKAIRAADKELALTFISCVPLDFNQFLLKKYTYSRPNVTLARHYSRVAKIKLKEQRRKHRDHKLSLRVPPVYFSPDLPVFIICRDRVEPLVKLVKWLEEEGLTNIIFIDNASTYKPLLDYFDKTQHTLIRLRANIGHTSPWVSGAVDIYANNKPYIVTDPDVIPLDEAHGAVKLFCDLLTKYPIRRKAGLGLKIDDLPDHYDLKKHVIAWEKQFWVTEVEKDVYDAEIDTTFAVYRQNTPYVMGPGLRTGGKFVARHEPWYIDSKNISEEVKYYRNHADKVIGSWGITTDEATDTYLGNTVKS